MSNQNTIQTLRDLGFKKAAELHSALGKQKIKMKVAYKNYSYVAREEMERMDNEIRKANGDGYVQRKQGLELIPIEEFTEIPEGSIFGKLREAKRADIFDDFMIVKTESSAARLFFGIVRLCGDYFEIGRWDKA